MLIRKRDVRRRSSSRQVPRSRSSAPPALAGPPPGFGAGGPPPGLGAGGPPLGGALGAPPRDIAGGPPHFSRLDGAGGPHGSIAATGEFSWRRGRATAYSANGYTRMLHQLWLWPWLPALALAAAAAYAYGRADASSDDGCYYVSAYGDTACSASVVKTDCDGLWPPRSCRRLFLPSATACKGKIRT